MLMKRRFSGLVVGSTLAVAMISAPVPRLGATDARADSALVTVLKNGLYGGATGLLLGAVVALVSDSDSRDDSIRWGVVIGTFAGCAYGVYEISHDEFSLRPVDEAPETVADADAKTVTAVRKEGLAQRGVPTSLRAGAVRTALVSE